MLELHGKYNTAKVFTNTIDTETISQITLLLNQEFTKDSDIRIMPDVHAGKGCVIGTTMTIQDKIVPNLVGVDIGCGMLAIKLEENEIDLGKLDFVIHKCVPSGYGIHEHAIVKTSELDFHLKDIKAPIDVKRVLKYLGTLGGGNHFIEVDKDSNGQLWLVIHSGSRHLGVEVCEHYQRLAIKTIKHNYIEKKIEDTIEKLTSAGKTYDIDNTVKILRMQPGPIPDDLCYLEGQDLFDYLHDMRITQKFATFNRTCIANSIIGEMGLHKADSFDTIHNYIDLNNKILRKGAVSAKYGEKLIIPLNMRDGSLICIGKGNPDWNFSAPHGAGRLMSRALTAETVDLKEFQETMQGIYSTSVCESTINESPFAYKPVQDIIDHIEATVDIMDMIKPIYNFKAH